MTRCASGLGRGGRLVAALVLAVIIGRGGATPRAAVAEELVWRPLGPSVEVVKSLAVGPPGTLYAGTTRDLFKSTNGGAAWLATGLNRNINQVHVDGGFVYAATTTGLFRSATGGATWEDITGILDNRDVLRIDANGSVVWAGTNNNQGGTFNGGLFESRNGGASFTKVPDLAVNGAMIRGLRIDPSNVESVVLCSGSSLVRRELQTSGAVFWRTKMPNACPTAFIFDPGAAATVYAGYGGGVLKSTNGGDTWTDVSPGLPLDINNRPGAGQALAFGSFGSADLYVATIAGVARSTNGAASWTDVSANLPFRDLRALTTTGNDVLVGTANQGIFTSPNQGTVWSPAGQGLRSPAIGALAAHPTSTARLLAGVRENVSAGSIVVSDDGGHLWQYQRSTIGGIDDFAFDPRNPSIAYAATCGFFITGACAFPQGAWKSADGGRTWNAATGNLPDAATRTHAVAVSPTTGAVLLGTVSAGLFRSNDGGGTWAAVATGATAIKTLVLDPGGSRVYLGTSAGVLRSTDGGATWSAANTGLGNLDVGDLAIDPNSPATLYAATAGGVFRSTTGGDSWTAVNAGLTATSIQRIALNPATPAGLAVATGAGGVFTSANRGDAWSPANDGLSGRSVNTLTFSAAGRLYAGTDAGVFEAAPPLLAVTEINPKAGLPSGGTVVAVFGTGFSTAPGGTTIRFGMNAAANVSCASTTRCTATSPAGNGRVHVTTTVGGQTSAETGADLFGYRPEVITIDPAGGSPAGGTTVNISGAGFKTSPGGTRIRFGNVDGVDTSCSSTTRCTSKSPPGGAGVVHLTATVDDVTSQERDADLFTYGVGITAIDPHQGRKLGGNTVTLFGFGFSTTPSATAVRFGPTSATDVACSSETRCTVKSPKLEQGLADQQNVIATVNGISSPATNDNLFTYRDVELRITNGDTVAEAGDVILYEGVGFDPTGPDIVLLYDLRVARIEIARISARERFNGSTRLVFAHRPMPNDYACTAGLRAEQGQVFSEVRILRRQGDGREEGFILGFVPAVTGDVKIRTRDDFGRTIEPPIAGGNNHVCAGEKLLIGNGAVASFIGPHALDTAPLEFSPRSEGAILGDFAFTGVGAGVSNVEVVQIPRTGINLGPQAIVGLSPGMNFCVADAPGRFLVLSTDANGLPRGDIATTCPAADGRTQPLDFSGVCANPADQASGTVASLIVEGPTLVHGNLTVTGDTTFRSGRLCVDGNLTLAGGIRGLGSSFVRGVMDITGPVEFKADDRIAFDVTHGLILRGAVCSSSRGTSVSAPRTAAASCTAPSVTPTATATAPGCSRGCATATATVTATATRTATALATRTATATATATVCSRNCGPMPTATATATASPPSRR
jgi:photosystem II stability/assembly factor-like uncharacterized protein